MNNKIPPPIVTLISGLAIYFSRNIFPNHHGIILDVFSALLLIFGIIIIRSAFLLFKNHQTTINPINLSKTSLIVNTGVFKHTRNPMYLGMVFILLSVALKFNIYGGLIVILIFFSLLQNFKLFLKRKLWKNYLDKNSKNYKKTTRRWL